MQDLVAGLLLWIASNSTLPNTAGEHPSVAFVSPSALVEVMYQGNVPAGVDRESTRVAGLYQFKQNIIYLRDDIDVRSIKGRALLVHELVHFLQHEGGLRARARCKQHLEPIAYELQIHYLAQHGLPSPFSKSHQLRMSECRG